MRLRRTIIILAVASTFVGLSGCKKKQPNVPPPQATAPPIAEQEPEVQAPPPTSGEPNRPQPEATKPAAPASEAAEASKPKVKTKGAIAKKSVPKAPQTPPRAVVPEGSNPQAQGQLTAQLSRQEALHDQLNTTQLLQATENNLGVLSKRQLSDADQAVVQHIRSYVQQSREATQEGDVERAYNLAFKAHLLSDELVKK